MKSKFPNDMKMFIAEIGKQMLSSEKDMKIAEELARDLGEEEAGFLSEALKKHFFQSWLFLHLASAAFEEGLLSKETLLEYFSEEFGRKGAAVMEKLLSEHSGCWESIKQSMGEPAKSWEPPSAKKGD